MTKKCRFCESQDRIKNNGTYAVLNGGKELLVRRWQCQNCGKSFSEHTAVVGVKRDRKTGEFSSHRIGSKYMRERRNKINSAIDDYITSYGFPKLDEITDELGISRKTYYEYLSGVTSSFENDFDRARNNLDLQEVLLLEWTKVHEKTKTRIRFLFIVDLKTQVIFDLIYYQKKLPRLPDVPNGYSFEQRADRFSEHTYNGEMIARHLKNLKAHFPEMTIQLSCSDYLKKRLIESSPELFKTANRKTLTKFRADLADFGFDRVIAFAWTFFGKKFAKTKMSKGSYLAPREQIKKTVRTLRLIYNRHQLAVNAKKSDKSKSLHRRRSQQKKSLHIVRKLSRK